MGLSSIGAWAQERPTANYELAARFSPEKVRKMVHSTEVRPNWFQSSDGFWYEYQTSEGKNWYIVDPNNRSKRPLFDRDALAAAITLQVQDPFDGQNLPIQDLKFLEAENALRFKVRSTKEVVKKDWEEIKRKDRSAKDSLEKKTFFFRYDLRTRELTEIEDYEEKEKRLSWANIAPDSSKIVFAKHYNLYWMDKENFLKAIKDEKDSTIVEHQLTEDGEKFFEWGGASRGEDNVEEEKNKDNRKRAGVLWAPNSKSFIVTRTDSRHVKDLWVLHNIRNPRPTLETYKYAMPGEKEQPQTTLHHYRFEGEEMRKLPVQTYKDQSLGVYSLSYPIEQADEVFKPVVWLGDDNGFYFSITSRDLKRIDICRWDLAEDEKKVLVEERSNTYIEIKKPYLVNNGRQFIHWSERDGWAHLYLYANDGTFVRRLTEGPYHVEAVETVDERTKTVFFTANAKEKDEDPYYEHLYSVSLDGGQPRLLNAGNFQHNTSIKTNGKFFVNNYSRVNSVPKSDLHNARGERVMSLEEADLSQLFAAGYQFPEPFKVKADDGITDLYGVMYKPFDFDSTKHYPIIQYVYPGPQTEAVNKAWSRGMDRTDRLAQLAS
ncbi:DPP IV N-terminal domain-containing protein [Nitritalea halalkaliphila]|uniref:DPP IV N-terminal domain-containing protein n=1 Tax=Nitritalea halalkaliphila TaxID=590849 RepID=UPI002934CE0B|nr:DPP IV N-terminal domain-containing protein [Nitritalea halalkaliphila]